MRAPTRERMMTARMISIMALVLAISIGFLVPEAAAQADQYPKMAPVEQYLMERNAEILLARSAAPNSVSSDATILVLGRQGYETAVRGKNGFVCLVERSWMAAFDSGLLEDCNSPHDLQTGSHFNSGRCPIASMSTMG